jgi:hypothetical protein
MDFHKLYTQLLLGEKQAPNLSILVFCEFLDSRTVHL